MTKLGFFRKLIKPGVVLALALGVLAVSSSNPTSAKALDKATYTIVVGSDTAYGLEPMAFYPQTLKVHRGDVVTWQFRGFHNVHFAPVALSLVAVNDIDDKKIPEFNPKILAPNVKSGAVF